MSSRRNWIRCRSAVVAAVLLVAACGGGFEFSNSGDTPTGVAVDLIQSDSMAQRLGIDTMTGAACDEPADIEVGAVFVCTADSGGQTVTFATTIDGPGQVFATPMNVIDRTLLPDYAASAVEVLNETTGLSLPTDVMDCGTKSAVLDENRQMICKVTDPDTGDVFDAQLTIVNPERAEFSVKILVGGE